MVYESTIFVRILILLTSGIVYQYQVMSLVLTLSTCPV